MHVIHPTKKLKKKDRASSSLCARVTRAANRPALRLAAADLPSASHRNHTIPNHRRHRPGRSVKFRRRCFIAHEAPASLAGGRVTSFASCRKETSSNDPCRFPHAKWPRLGPPAISFLCFARSFSPSSRALFYRHLISPWPGLRVEIASKRRFLSPLRPFFSLQRPGTEKRKAKRESGSYGCVRT